MCERKSSSHVEATGITCETSADVQRKLLKRYLRVAGKTRKHATSFEVRVRQHHRQLYAQPQGACHKRSPPRSSAVQWSSSKM